MTNRESMDIEYSTTKAEIQKWYWEKWKMALWKFHVLIFIVVFGFVFINLNRLLASMGVKILYSTITGFVPIFFMILYPIFMHKPQVRKLHIDKEGIKTTVAAKSAAIKWESIESILKDEKYIYINGKNGNAFVIPDRAFKDKEMRNSFFSVLMSYFKETSNTKRPLNK